MSVSVRVAPFIGELNRIPDLGMFPDLRLLISATIATFFLAATAGLYASLRITQDQMAAHGEVRAAIEETPIARIVATWPIPEPDRVAAMRELMRIAKAPPVAATEPADMPDPTETDIAPQAIKPETPADDTPAHESKGSNGIATQQEVSTNTQSDHPDIQGNVSDAPDMRKTTVIIEKAAAAMKKAHLRKKKPAKIVQRRKQIARQPEPRTTDPWLLNGYPLYLTVPLPGS
jgi:hypothetical protein